MEKNLFGCPVEFSEAALQSVLDIYNTKNIPAQYALRLAVSGGGCSVVDYQIGFDLMGASDRVYPLIEDIQLIIDKKHQMYLYGLKVDYISNETEQGFEFIKT